MRPAFRDILALFPRRAAPIFAPDALDRVSGHEGYAQAAPFPYAVLDGLFDAGGLRRTIREFPDPAVDAVEAHDDGVFVRRKHNTTWETRFGPQTRQLFAAMASPRWLLALERLTGISGLMPDPYLFGAGLHLTGLGGTLAIHADFNRHPKLNLDRRVNVLLYLNEGWTEDNRGWLELWDRDMTACVARVAPVFNRLAIFNTTSFTFHGQPEPVSGGPGTVRRSAAFYYYSNGRPSEEIAAPDHSTVWRDRPGIGY